MHPQTGLLVLTLLAVACGSPRIEGPLGPANGQMDVGGEALFEAAARGQLAAVREELNQGAPPNTRVEHGLTPLIIAAYAGHVDVVRTLLDGAADANLANDDQETPLHVSGAATEGADAIVADLLDHGAAVDRIDSHGRSALSNHAASGHVRAVALLLAAGADIDAADGDGQTPLFSAARAGHADVVEILLSRGARVDTPNRFGADPLIGAASEGHLEAVRMLLANGAVEGRRTNDGFSAMARMIAGVAPSLIRPSSLQDQGSHHPPVSVAALRRVEVSLNARCPGRLPLKTESVGVAQRYTRVGLAVRGSATRCRSRSRSRRPRDTRGHRRGADRRR